MTIKWNEIIDSQQLNVESPIEKVNAFLWRNTTINYFLFNDKIYKVMHPLQFSLETSETKFTVRNIE